MPANYSAVWKDCGFFGSTPPCLIVPYEGLALVCLNGARPFDVNRDLRFDRTNLTVEVVSPAGVLNRLMIYADNFPQAVRSDVLALGSRLLNVIQFGSTVLSVEGSVTGSAAGLDCISRSGTARLDVVTVKRRKIGVAFRFIRYKDAAGQMKAGTSIDPAEAEKLLDVMNRLYLPSANIELTLSSARAENLNQALGPAISVANFQNYVVPLRDPNADVTVFFVGKWKGTTDPLGSAFVASKSVVVDDAPHQHVAPQGGWPPHQVTDDQLRDMVHGSNNRAATDRDLHIVLAHEIAHILGAGHNDGSDNLMSMNRQDLKLNRDIVLAIGGK
jgi:hypothetical protein